MHFASKLFTLATGPIDFRRLSLPDPMMTSKRKKDVQLCPAGGGSNLLDLPIDLLVNDILALLNVRDICRLKCVCSRLNAVCSANSGHLPKVDAGLALIRCGHWHDGLPEGRQRRRDPDSLVAIDFDLPLLVAPRPRRSHPLGFAQLVDHFAFRVAFVHVQLLNAETLERLRVGRIRARHLLLDFSQHRGAKWPILRYFHTLLEELSANKWAERIELVFAHEREVRLILLDRHEGHFCLDKRVSVSFLAEEEQHI